MPISENCRTEDNLGASLHIPPIPFMHKPDKHGVISTTYEKTFWEKCPMSNIYSMLGALAVFWQQC